jgi:hypothetical protein
MAENQKTFNIFYSWQSDLPATANRNFIKKALIDAVSELEKTQPGLQIEIDQATSRKPGSPDIAKTICDKIIEADMFICDVTTINSTSSTKKTPNPNVVFELGFAVATIGWDRVVLLFNKCFGDLANDLPFDFQGHRVSDFSADEKTKKPDAS